MQPKLTVISSLAEDRLLDENDQLIGTQTGGPAHYIGEFLTQMGTPFVSKIAADKVVVEIMMTSSGELGRVPGGSGAAYSDFSGLATPNLMVSTVLDEVDLVGLKDFKGNIFLDVQGFVRDADNFGRKHAWTLPDELEHRVFCLKGTEEELRYIPHDLLNNQKNRMLLITKGIQGAELYYHGAKTVVRPHRIIDTDNAIGAGDTFFAAFVSKFIETASPEQSLDFALSAVEDFLSRR